jgi:hypothetical protein
MSQLTQREYFPLAFYRRPNVARISANPENRLSCSSLPAANIVGVVVGMVAFNGFRSIGMINLAGGSDLPACVFRFRLIT